ncbi:hypothetical protein CYMTET_29801 [Cymbomonas tetramitiformis]|uniref:Uncharacterized protein n=1 Tax=Cymbomonas tetramitiformis TaxID=36881 RepID=A0AAE0FKP5_9CHLO|nr:hypothetical protein CYMTET_29801 [Cymbomonas tetramitiformis]
MEKMKKKRAEMVEQRKKDSVELQNLQKQYYEEELQRLKNAGEGWAEMKAFKSALNRVMDEQKKRVKDRQGGNDSGIAAQAAAMAADMDTGEMPVLKLGDASVAAPFTSKLPSIKSCVDVIRQGRCTLVSTIQMQQILALNCLIAAYSLSALYLDGVRSGEAQMIASGVLLTIASLAFSYARPVDKLSEVRPITTIFHPAISISIVGQLLIHLYCMVRSINMAKEFSSAEELEELSMPSPISPGLAEEESSLLMKPFKPTLLNTVVFLVETSQQVSVMAVNYKGRPFMIASTENAPMLYSLLACCLGTFIAAFEVIPELNSLLQLVPLPSDEFRLEILRILSMSVGGAFLWDRICVAIFAPKLVWAGYRDAWEAAPSFKEAVAKFGKVAIFLVAGGVYLYTENMMRAQLLLRLFQRHAALEGFEKNTRMPSLYMTVAYASLCYLNCETLHANCCFQ